MPQQYPYGSANDKWKKKLFVETGVGSWKEVEARIVEPYTPPTPKFKTKELDIINAPSHFSSNGISSYKVTLNLLFQDKASFAEYMMFAGWQHKFYDEKGAIYLGVVDSMKATAKEASRRYLVEIGLVLVKKDSYDDKHKYQFQDIDGHPLEWDIEEMADLGLLAVVAGDGQPVLYFRPDAYITRAEFITFLNRTRRFVERIVRE